MISCILLCAGFSERFGSPKALAEMSPQTTALEHLQKTLLQTSFDEIIIVLGAKEEKIKPFCLKNNRIKCITNENFILGQTSSFKIGLQLVHPEANMIGLLPVDYPWIQTQTINDLIKTFEKNPSSLLAIPTYQNKKGHPPLFSTKLRNEFLELNNNLGLNTIPHHHLSETLFVPTQDRGVISTFNTPEEFQNLRQQFTL